MNPIANDVRTVTHVVLRRPTRHDRHHRRNDRPELLRAVVAEVEVEAVDMASNVVRHVVDPGPGTSPLVRTIVVRGQKLGIHRIIQTGMATVAVDHVNDGVHSRVIRVGTIGTVITKIVVK
jgi:hypothetical protein